MIEFVFSASPKQFEGASGGLPPSLSRQHAGPDSMPLCNPVFLPQAAV